ncbi:MAG: BACON domain-containing protein [Alistipes finegoldii]
MTAYYPATTAEGVVAVEAERTIALDAESQSNPARAPLVGLPTSGNLAEGALEVTFRNIFSVIELRIDAGELASAAQSLTVEPADEAAFEGFLSFEGTVDPETLALTPAENGTGNSLVFNFAEGVDLTKPQTIKFPVGRFRSEAGLRLTLGTADGKSYSKNIYKTGITSYAEQGGVFRAKHMAKALYAFAPQGGISTADDLIEFAAAVNAGETLAPWQDDKGVVVLLDDIDLAEVTEWTPIGAATSKLASNALSITSGRPFTGYFDGQGHTIRNLKMVCKAAQATSAWGFFGAVANGAVVENLIFDASCSLEDKATAGTDCGVVAGLVYEATVRNVVNKASIAFDGAAPDETRMTIGMVGLAFADKNGARLEKLVNHGALTATSGGNTKNGATGIHVGGIVGFSSNKSNTTAVVTIAECANYGDLDTQVARASGIVAAANRYTEIENCVNEGDNVNAFATVNSARIGNITCITAVGSKITNTVNRGNVICKTSGAAGGIICLVNDDGNAFVGCENYGLVITDRASYKGTLFGQCNKAARFSDCIAQGDLGAYEDGSYALVGVNYTNYMSYIGDHNATAVHVNSQNILYYPNGSQVPAEPEFGVNLSSVELNAQGSNAAVVQLSSVDYDWTVSADGDWAHITDLSDVPVVSGVKDPGVQYIKIGADANTKTAPRSAVVTFASTDGSKSATVRVDQQARGEAFPSKWVFQSFDAAALRLVVDRRQRHSCDIGRGGLHFGRARRCECFGRFQAERRYEPSCGFDDGRRRLLALYLPGGESRRRIGRRFQRHDGGRSQFAQILHRRIPRRRSLEERRGRSAHGSGKPGCPLYLQVFGHCHRVLVSARDRHADDALRKRRDRRRSENPLPRRGTLYLRGRYAEHHGDQRRQFHSSLRIYGQLRAELRHGDAP